MNIIDELELTQEARYTELAIATWLERFAEVYGEEAKRAFSLAAEDIRSGVWCNRPSQFFRGEQT